MFGQRSEEHVPTLVAGSRRFLVEQPCPRSHRLPAVLLQELSDEAPSRRLGRTDQQFSEPHESQGLVCPTPPFHPTNVSPLYNPSINDNRNGWGFWQIKNATGSRVWLQSIRPADKRR